ncbi:MAG: hypothetical protein B7X95_05315 [Methylophilaceae bacterium 17-44-8]|nr:MAG: hypothetical protein B7X95_05315 [Methylophilaceae bacterium 17-44-8]
MIKARSQISVRKPVSKVYSFVVTDFFKNYPRWSPEVIELESIGANTIALGVRGRQIRIDQGRRSETRFQITELVDQKRAVFDGDLQAKFSIRYDFQPKSDEETILYFEFELKKIDLFMMPFQKISPHP